MAVKTPLILNYKLCQTSIWTLKIFIPLEQIFHIFTWNELSPLKSWFPPLLQKKDHASNGYHQQNALFKCLVSQDEFRRWKQCTGVWRHRSNFEASHCLSSTPQFSLTSPTLTHREESLVKSPVMLSCFVLKHTVMLCKIIVWVFVEGTCTWLKKISSSKCISEMPFGRVELVGPCSLVPRWFSRLETLVPGGAIYFNQEVKLSGQGGSSIYTIKSKYVDLGGGK